MRFQIFNFSRSKSADSGSWIGDGNHAIIVCPRCQENVNVPLWAVDDGGDVVTYFVCPSCGYSTRAHLTGWQDNREQRKSEDV